jgi:hypothetical protein
VLSCYAKIAIAMKANIAIFTKIATGRIKNIEIVSVFGKMTTENQSPFN